MKYQEHIICATKEAVKEAFSYAEAVPEDKLDWKPLDAGRSVLDICRELAMCPEWGSDLLEGKPHEFNEAVVAEIEALQSTWKTLADCREQCDARLAKFMDVVRAFPDERLSETVWLPYDGGRDFAMSEVMDYPRWNFNYHLGQIAYIQTLYGDRDMH